MFVELKPGVVVSASEIIDFCRGQMARFKAPRAVESAKKLVAISDVVAESFRPGVMDRLGLGYEALRALRTNLFRTVLTLLGIMIGVGCVLASRCRMNRLSTPEYGLDGSCRGPKTLKKRRDTVSRPKQLKNTEA